LLGERYLYLTYLTYSNISTPDPSGVDLINDISFGDETINYLPRILFG